MTFRLSMSPKTALCRAPGLALIVSLGSCGAPTVTANATGTIATGDSAGSPTADSTGPGTEPTSATNTLTGYTGTDGVPHSTSISSVAAPPECPEGSHRCTGQILEVCTAGGNWIEKENCDVLQGLLCDSAGFCTGPCAGLGRSYIGCDYYAVSMIAQLPPGGHFALAVANTGAQSSHVTITYDGDVIEERTVAVGAATAIILPIISALTSTGETLVVPGGAYRLRATAPVTVWEFNTLELSTSNDASLLLPTNTWAARHVVTAWHHWDTFNSPSAFAIVASDEETTVTLVPPNGGTPTEDGAGIDGQGHGSVMLDAGDVLQVQSNKTGDFTGTQVIADKPVQVIAGHECTSVPSDSYPCDHLEESILPFEALGREYVVVPPVQWPDRNLDKSIFVRVVAAEDQTTLEFAPDQPAPTFLAQIGDFVEIGPTTDRFVVTADRKIIVAQYMVSMDFGDGIADPSMVLAIPREQFRAEYVVYAHPTWPGNFADIVAPLDATVHVDGSPVPLLEPIGASGLGFVHVQLSNAGDGSHRVVGDTEFGISVYGLGEAGSYWYPGGLEVEVIPPG